MLYKYKSLGSFDNFVDIILNERIYAAPYFELNDPMEGLYRYAQGTINKQLIEKIKGKKEKIRICSLSRNCNSTLMWSHYADGHKGVAIGVKVHSCEEVGKVRYEGMSFVQNAARIGSDKTAKNILTCKLDSWVYEEEERVFVTTGKYAKVMVSEVVLGSRISDKHKSLVRKLVKSINRSISVRDTNIENFV
jgi:hypothetical protein